MELREMEPVGWLRLGFWERGSVGRLSRRER